MLFLLIYASPLLALIALGSGLGRRWRVVGTALLVIWSLVLWFHVTVPADDAFRCDSDRSCSSSITTPSSPPST